MSKVVSPEQVLLEVSENYKRLETSIVNQLWMQASNHYPTIGSYRENVWESLLEGMIPKKYCIDQSVFIIDSYGNISKEVDLVVFDETYTPYIFRCGKIKFIPIEAVSVVVQCKSKIRTSGKMQNELDEWVESIDKLKTSLDSVVRMATDIIDSRCQKYENNLTQTSTRPIKILCALTIAGTMKDKYEDKFDILLFTDEKDVHKHLHKHIKNEEKGLVYWNKELNHFGLERYKNVKGTDPNKIVGWVKGAVIIDEKEYRDKCLKEQFDAGTELEDRHLADLKVSSQNDNNKDKSEDKDEGKDKDTDTNKDKDNDKDENVIMSLTFQLNQLLMLINNPMLFPHRAYAQRFSEILKHSTGKEVSDKNE